VFGVSPALLLGLLAGILAWIPYLGSVAGYVTVVLVAATDFPDHQSSAYYCLALFLCVRLPDDFVLLAPDNLPESSNPATQCSDAFSRRHRGRRHRIESGSTGIASWP
jgi:hypothetical protein